MRTTWLDHRIAEVREKLTPADEASLWTLFFHVLQGQPAVACAIDGAMDEMDLDLLRKYAAIVNGVPAAGCLLAVIRADGRPRPADRQLWRDVRVLLRDSSTRLLGFVVVGTTAYWSAEADGDLGSAA